MGLFSTCVPLLEYVLNWSLQTVNYIKLSSWSSSGPMTYHHALQKWLCHFCGGKSRSAALTLHFCLQRFKWLPRDISQLHLFMQWLYLLLLSSICIYGYLVVLGCHWVLWHFGFFLDTSFKETVRNSRMHIKSVNSGEWLLSWASMRTMRS